METETEIARLTVVEHRCYCVIVYAHPQGRQQFRVRCEAEGLGPDEPYCEVCEGRHPEASDDPFVAAVTQDAPVAATNGRWL